MKLLGSDATADVEQAYRAAHGAAVATLTRLFGDITLAEDAVQDAFVIASDRWRDGVPPNPAGWIITTARNRAIDTLRRTSRGRELEAAVAQSAVRTDEVFEDAIMKDDQLKLIFTCCHPALRVEHRVALTLRLLGGLSVEEVARSFLVSEAAMAKRLVRAKYKIKAARVPYRVPPAEELPKRLGAVLAVLYLVYNTGADDPARAALRADAIRMARSLAELLPGEPEVAGLLALLLLNESRIPARTAGGEPVVLRDQDRSRWDPALIVEGQGLVRECIRRNRPGPYQLQAAIQAVHSASHSVESTDWEQIVSLYDQLMNLAPTPVVALNRAIAVGERDGPAPGLAETEKLEETLDTYYLFHATRGTLLESLGRNAEARAAFERAVEMAPTDQNRRFLDGRLRDLA